MSEGELVGNSALDFIEQLRDAGVNIGLLTKQPEKAGKKMEVK